MSDFFAAGNGEPRSRHHVTILPALFQARVPAFKVHVVGQFVFSDRGSAIRKAFLAPLLNTNCELVSCRQAQSVSYLN
jgi:hypothetical protein